MTLPYQWRVSKYDPALRNEKGHFLPHDWTFFAQVGQIIDGILLTYGDYVAVENAYVRAAYAFLADAGLEQLRAVSLHASGLANVSAEQLRDIVLSPTSIAADAWISQGDLGDTIRLNLREILHCELVAKRQFFLHFGYDYYLYVGSRSPSVAAIQKAQNDGLFVEPMLSPYL